MRIDIVHPRVLLCMIGWTNESLKGGKGKREYVL